MLPASPRQAPPLDTRLRIETPEGIDLILRPAGLVSRAMAFSIDLALRGITLLAGYLLLSLLGNLGLGLAAIGFFLINWWYPVLFEVLNQGRTPGKQLMKLKVIHDDGTPIGWSSSLIRNLLRVVDMLPFGYAAGALACLNLANFQRLGDLAGGTLVVHQDALRARPTLPAVQPAVTSTVTSAATPLVLQAAEQRAIIEFAERQGDLSAARIQELASLLDEPLGVPPEQSLAHLNGIARHWLGAQ